MLSTNHAVGSDENSSSLHGHAIARTGVSHRRYLPTTHHLKYDFNYYWLSLSALPEFAQHSRLASIGKLNLLSFYPKDYLHFPDKYSIDNSIIGLQKRVCQLIDNQFDSDIKPDKAHIQLLTLPRHGGRSFNPVSFYFVYANQSAEQPSYFIAEITNTPWGERFQYAFEWQQSLEKQRFEFAKAFHVSPFFPMDIDYIWEVTLSHPRSNIRMQLRQNNEAYFDAFMHWTYDFLSESTHDLAEAKPQRSVSLTKTILSAPLQTLRVMWLIYKNAWTLHRKKVPFFPHHDKAHKPASAKTSQSDKLL